MLHFLKKIILFFNKTEGFVSSLFLAIMALVIIVQVIFRYFISYSLAWPEELGRYLFIASVFIGASYAEQEERHLAITVIRTNCGKWCARYIPILVQIIVVIFTGTMAVWGTEMVVFMYDSNQLAPAIEIPMFVVYAMIPLGMATMTLRAFVNLLKYIKTSPSQKMTTE